MVCKSVTISRTFSGVSALFVIRDLNAELLESRKDTSDPVGLEVREGRPDIVRRQVALFLSTNDQCFGGIDKRHSAPGFRVGDARPTAIGIGWGGNGAR